MSVVYSFSSLSFRGKQEVENKKLRREGEWMGLRSLFELIVVNATLNTSALLFAAERSIQPSV